MSATLKTIGILGLILFSLLFGLTYGLPDAVEKSAKGFIQQQIAIEVEEKYNEIKTSTLAQKVLSIAGKLGFEKDQIITDLENDVPQKIASTLAAMCGYDCEKKKALASSITQSYEKKISNIEVAEYNLGEVIKGKYLEIVGNLKFDLRIFLGTNAAMFLVLLLIAFLKPNAVAQLFVPGILLLTATAVSSGIYIFEQDWFYTILYNDYMGFGYLAYLSIIFAFLMDVTFNSARVTTELLNAICNAIGSSLSFVPC
jgi:hypothetical protein